MIIVAGAIVGAIACTLMAVLAKQFNLGLAQNIALGALCCGGTVALAGGVAPSHLAGILLGLVVSLICMAAIGAVLNHRAR